MAFFACVLADSMGMDSRSLFWFRLGALLHDIGKIIVPTEVLNKAGNLSDEEWAIMKRHPEAGLELVADIDFPGDVRAIIRNHHERWDGKGYPDGLAGADIPFAARILCVADVYDALTTARSYRDSLSHDRAVEVMRGSPGQFDPELLDAFLAGQFCGRSCALHSRASHTSRWLDCRRWVFAPVRRRCSSLC